MRHPSARTLWAPLVQPRSASCFHPGCWVTVPAQLPSRVEQSSSSSSGIALVLRAPSFSPAEAAAAAVYDWWSLRASAESGAPKANRRRRQQKTPRLRGRAADEVPRRAPEGSLGCSKGRCSRRVQGKRARGE
ncbi:Hypothetical predicted protein [Podarcis lilfordi]|uniref:Uncharacterized protein n=1 Tax=Podarcis lilfordi TaxID=74358 RepID=A0AA35KE29_9SAUR|nr:Hypothetical predicted protein [Podarcis lilfordi]